VSHRIADVPMPSFSMRDAPRLGAIGSALDSLIGQHVAVQFLEFEFLCMLLA
jgi:hypothetical protein